MEGVRVRGGGAVNMTLERTDPHRSTSDMVGATMGA